MSELRKDTAYVNRKNEMEYLKKYINDKPEHILFLQGPKSSGKTTLIYKFLNEIKKEQKIDVKHFNLRQFLIYNYKDFLRCFFEIDYSKSKEDVKEKREYDLKVFKMSVEVLKGMDSGELEPFKVMEKELQKNVDKGIKNLIIIDELQSLQDIYINGQRLLINEMFNFFVSMTKEIHL